MGLFSELSKKISRFGNDEEFLGFIKLIESLVSKILSLAMIVVILVAVGDLIVLLFQDITAADAGGYYENLGRLFGLFLNILIALELLDNITAYLRKHVVQVELVIVTSLIAVARKIIILDLDKIDGTELIGLAITIFSLSISYLIVRKVGSNSHD